MHPTRRICMPWRRVWLPRVARAVVELLRIGRIGVRAAAEGSEASPRSGPVGIEEAAMMRAVRMIAAKAGLLMIRGMASIESITSTEVAIIRIITDIIGTDLGFREFGLEWRRGAGFEDGQKDFRLSRILSST